MTQEQQTIADQAADIASLRRQLIEKEEQLKQAHVDALNLELHNKAAWDLVRRHEENQRSLIADMEMLNTLQRKDTPVLRHKEASDQEGYRESEEVPSQEIQR